MQTLKRLAISIVASYGAGFLGTLFINHGTRAWYEALAKPFFAPASWIFAPVWLILYGLMALALFLVWQKDPEAEEFRGWVPLFFAHLLANAAWAIFFFGYHSILIALIDIIILWIVVLLLTLGASPIDKRASWLLALYLLWVTFAMILNAAIWFLN